MKKKKRVILTIAAALVPALAIWIAWGNTALELNAYSVASGRLPHAFDGYRIAHVSDLHNCEMGDNNEALLKLLRDAQPDIIAITGDFVDCRTTNVDIAIAFAEEAAKIAPCYYVTGNHEARLPYATYARLKKGLVAAGVTVLHNNALLIEKDGAHICLVGLADPGFTAEYDSSMTAELIRKLSADNRFTLVLSHRPELFAQYVEAEADLVLSGHTHGGQFRLPFVGGLIAPSQGLFPKYDAGRYAEAYTTMVISRGIGNSRFPFRINNRPEVILIELHTD